MTDASYPHLFQPGRIGSLEIKNRMVTAPMTRVSADPDGVPNPPMIDYYRAYGEGGFGLVITEGTYIDETHAQGYRNQPGIANERHVEGWRPIVEAVHATGTPIFQQLIHAGALIQESASDRGAIAPSAIQPKGEKLPFYYGEGPFDVPAEISEGQIEETVNGFADAARRSLEAGFDGVEIHGANGYIVDQFLTTYTNQRTDGFGGSLDNRLRFPAAVLRAVVEAVGDRGQVGIRISQTKVNDFEHVWEGGVDDARMVFSTLAAENPDYIHISTHKGLETVFGTDRHLADYAKEYSGLTIVACGALNDPERADGIVARGEADFTAMAKGALADPSLPSKVGAGIEPIPFDRGMISPKATIQNTAAWKQDNL